MIRITVAVSEVSNPIKCSIMAITNIYLNLLLQLLLKIPITIIIKNN